MPTNWWQREQEKHNSTDIDVRISGNTRRNQSCGVRKMNSANKLGRLSRLHRNTQTATASAHSILQHGDDFVRRKLADHVIPTSQVWLSPSPSLWPRLWMDVLHGHVPSTFASTVKHERSFRWVPHPCRCCRFCSSDMLFAPFPQMSNVFAWERTSAKP